MIVVCGKRYMVIAVMMLMMVVTVMSQPRYKIIDYKKLNDAVTTVNRIVRDNQGMMWFATDDGLYRYDGYDFVNFKSRSGEGVNMPSNRINSVYASSEGGIWCLVSGRVFLFDTHTCRFLDVMDNFEKEKGHSYHIRKLRALACGTTWLFAEDGSVFALEDAHPMQSVRLVAENEQPDNITVVCDSMHRSWVLTDKHTYLYSKKKMVRFDQAFRYVVVDGSYIWLLDKDGQPSLFDEQQKKMKPWRHPALTSAVGSLSVLSDGRIAMAGDKQLLLVSADSKMVAPTKVTWPVQKVMEDADGRLWILAKDGHLSLTDRNCQQVTIVVGVQAKEKCDIMRDKHGVVWIFTGEGETFYATNSDPTHPVRYTGDELQVSIRNTIEDGQGGYWLINKNHANRLTFESPHFRFLDLHQPDQVRCVATDGQGHVFVATRYDESVAMFSTSGERLGWLGRDGRIHTTWVGFGAAVYSSCLSSDGTLWLGTKRDGLFRLRTQQDGGYQISQYKKEEGLDAGRETNTVPDNEIYDISEDRLHRLWIATHKGGLCCIKDAREETPHFVSATNGLTGWTADKTVSVRALLITPSDQLLVGTYSGLFVADISGRDLSKIKFKDHQREQNRKDCLSSGCITDIVRTADGRIFLSTCDGGVNELLTDNVMTERLIFRHYNRTTGFPTDITHALMEYGDALWVVAPNQLLELPLNKSQLSGTNSFLLRERPCFSSCRPVHAGQGVCVFGSEEGALMMNLNELKNSSFVPPMVITGVSKENGAVDYGMEHRDTIVLEPKERNLTILFSALDYEDTELVAYAYRMNDSKGWTYIGQNHSVSLAQLLPGTYRITIRSTNSNGAWCDNGRTLTIVVKPTFWETPWAKLLIALVALALIGVIAYTFLYIRRIKRKQRETMEAYLSLLESASKPMENEQIMTGEKHLPSSSASSDTENIPSEDDLLMKRVLLYMEEKLGDSDVTLDDIAQAVAVSRTSLHRKMKQLTGSSPMDFLREARIRKSVKMLSSSSRNISEIAYDCGFSDPKYFSKCFKSATGLTPTEYRRKMSE